METFIILFIGLSVAAWIGSQFGGYERKQLRAENVTLRAVASAQSFLIAEGMREIAAAETLVRMEQDEHDSEVGRRF